MELWAYWTLGLAVATLAGAQLVRRYRDTYGYPALVGIYVAFILVSNLLAGRLVYYEIFGVEVVTAGATLVFPFVAQVVDMVNEVYGRRATYMAVLVTLVCNAVASILVWHVSFERPALEVMEVPPVYEEAWRFFMLQAPRIVLASYLAFYVANTLDAKVFADLKRYFYTRYREAYKDVRTIALFVLARSVASDLVNMVVDSLVFFPVAYLFTFPLEALPGTMLGGAYVKVVAAILMQPFLIAYRVLIRDVERVVD